MTEIAITKKTQNVELRKLALIIVTTIIERLPILLRKNEQTMKEVIQVILSYMSEIDESDHLEWEKPAEGNNYFTTSNF